MVLLFQSKCFYCTCSNYTYFVFTDSLNIFKTWLYFVIYKNKCIHVQILDVHRDILGALLKLIYCILYLFDILHLSFPISGTFLKLMYCALYLLYILNVSFLFHATCHLLNWFIVHWNLCILYLFCILNVFLCLRCISLTCTFWPFLFYFRYNP